MSKEFYITSQGGCISTKGFFKDNLTTKDGNIDVWEDEASALRSIEIVRETWENNLANKKKAVKLTDDSFIHLYERWIKGLEKDLKWLDTCVVKELCYNKSMSHIEEQLTEIASKFLNMKSLKISNDDSKDFKEVAVWEVAEALEKAYALGIERGSPKWRKKLDALRYSSLEKGSLPAM